MDEQEENYHNFSTSSSHRLPTINGTQALHAILQSVKPISTNIPVLDGTLASLNLVGGGNGGIQPGIVTEVYGPPGVGKTTFGMQLASNVICLTNDRCRVTWIDTSSCLTFTRLHELTEANLAASPPRSSSPPMTDTLSTAQDKLAQNLDYRQITNLPRFLTLFVHPTPDFPAPNTGLIVIDDMSNFLSASLPRSGRSRSDGAPPTTPKAIRDNDGSRRMASRRINIISSLATALQKLAAARNLAIVVLNQTMVSQQGGQKAALRSALSSPQWDFCVTVRVALYRDFWPLATRFDDETEERDEEGNTIPRLCDVYGYRVAEVERLEGRTIRSRPIGFIITQIGIQQIEESDEPGEHPTGHLQLSRPAQLNALASELEDPEAKQQNPSLQMSEDDLHNSQAHTSIASDANTRAVKRKAFEIADSDEEDGAISEPELPPMIVPHTTFRRSSQLREVDIRDQPRLQVQTKRVPRVKTSGVIESEPNEEEEEDEMLLDEHENLFPPFSQAALNLTDPLTPSDDGRGSP